MNFKEKEFFEDPNIVRDKQREIQEEIDNRKEDFSNRDEFDSDKYLDIQKYRKNISN